MVEWLSPEVQLKSARALILFIHATFGIYLWEFLISLDFDWKFWTGKEKWRWTYVPYFLTRYTALAALTLMLRLTNALEPMNCQPLTTAIFAMAHISLGFASLLLLMRVVAISNKNKYVCVFLGAYYLVNWAFLIRGIWLGRTGAFWLAALQTCGSIGTHVHDVNVWVTFGFDFSCAAVMVIVLASGGRGRGGSLWRTCLAQGVVWFALATISYLTSAIFLTLNLNDPVNTIPEIAALVSMSICATRMYRSLFIIVKRGPHTPNASGAHQESDTIMGSGRSIGRTTLPVAIVRSDVTTHHDMPEFKNAPTPYKGKGSEEYELGQV